jgi:hypothetical protein
MLNNKMGIRLLNKFLQTKCGKPTLKKIHMREFENKHVAVDILNYLYRFKGDDRLIENLFIMCNIFKRYNISPIFVYDGKPPEIKKDTINLRSMMKKKNKKKYDISLLQKRKYHTLEMIKLRRSCVMLTKNDLLLTKSIIKNYGMSYIQCYGESDPVCVELVKTNKAYACLSDDMDMIGYGCPRVLRYFSILKGTVVQYTHKQILNDLNKINHDDFVTLCILAGTDYGKFTKNIFLWYEDYIQYMKCDNESFIGYLLINQNIEFEDVAKIETIREMYQTEKTLKQYPFQTFKIKPMRSKELMHILEKDNFMFADHHMRLII